MPDDRYTNYMYHNEKKMVIYSRLLLKCGLVTPTKRLRLGKFSTPSPSALATVLEKDVRNPLKFLQKLPKGRSSENLT